MNSLNATIPVIWFATSMCVTSHGQVDPNAQSTFVASEIAALHAARQPALPQTISPKEAAYLTIQMLGQAKVNKQQAANELVEWLFVREQRPYTTEKFSPIDIHPAANALIAIEAEAITPLKNRLMTASYEDAVLILRCLQHIYKTDSTMQLQQINSQSTSQVVRKAISYVLSEPRETSGVALEPES